jgi:predicted transcriptional regulator
MKLMDCLVRTPVLKPEMTIREALEACVTCDVYGLPVAESNGRVVGRFSVRNMFLIASIPEDLIKHAHLICKAVDHLDFKDCMKPEFLARPVSDVMISQVLHLSPDSQVLKALALMEQYHTAYLFVVDEQDNYLGTVTRLGIARHILQQQAK